MAQDIFISHSARDKVVADAVCAALENAGIRCWIAPRDVQPGRSFAGEITRAIQQSKVMVLIFSAHSNNSEQVLREVQLAVGSHLHIIQFRIEDVRPNDDLTYFLSTPHWLDALTPPLERHLQRLVTSVETLLGNPAEDLDEQSNAVRRNRPATIHPQRQRSFPWLWIGLAALVLAAVVASYYFRPGLSLPPASPLTAGSPQSHFTPTVSPTPAREIVIEFPDVPVKGPDYVVSASPYLHGFGISVKDLQPEDSRVILVNNLGLYGGQAVYPTTSQNMLTQGNTGNVAASFTLRFSQPASRVGFTRPQLYPETESGVTHPAWSVHALDADGNELSSQSEGLLRCDQKHEVPARTYLLHAPAFAPIVALRFDSDPRLNGRPFAAFSALLIERITLVPISDPK